MRLTNPYLRLVKDQLGGEKSELFTPPTAQARLFYRERRLGDRTEVDIDTIIKKNAQCFGITGSGKTNTGAVVAEALLDEDLRICVFDSAKRDFASLAEKYEKVKIVGFEGDAELRAREFYASEESWVFNTLGITKAQYVPWMLTFLKTLHQEAMNRKRMADETGNGTFISPIKIFIDEAWEYLPSDISTVTNAEMRQVIKKLIEVVEDMHRQGRAFGLTFFIMCQRPTDMISSIRSQTGMYFLHQQTAFIEKDYYMKIIPSQTNSDRQAIRKFIHTFPPGWCYFVLEKEAMRVRVLTRKTQHSSRDIGLADARKWKSLGGQENAQINHHPTG